MYVIITTTTMNNTMIITLLMVGVYLVASNSVATIVMPLTQSLASYKSAQISDKQPDKSGVVSSDFNSTEPIEVTASRIYCNAIYL